jgi:hypothetical protein
MFKEMPTKLWREALFLPRADPARESSVEGPDVYVRRVSLFLESFIVVRLNGFLMDE